MATPTRIVVQDDKDGPLDIREITLPDPAPHQVLVEMIATGVCHSQIFWMHQNRTAPMLFGHEGYGVVTATGSAVTTVAPGDTVMITWLPRTSVSRRPEVSGVELPDGTRAQSPNVYTWAEHALVDELYIYPLTDHTHDETVSIVGCAIFTGAGSVIHSGALEPGGTVAVFGVGGVGLAAIAGARQLGAQHIVAVDRIARKLDFAKQFGATELIDATTTDPVARIHELIHRPGYETGVDLALDCVGAEITTRQALKSVRKGVLGSHRGGTASIVGLPQGEFPVDVPELLYGQKTLSGALAGSCQQEDIGTFLDWYADGALDLQALVTNRYPFDDIVRAVDDLAHGAVLGRAIVTT